MSNIVKPTANANTPTVKTDATALAANASRQGWSIQNQGTNALRVCLGGTASSTVYHHVLQGCTGAADGKGGVFSQMSGTVFTGEVTVDGTSPSYTVIEH